MQHNKPGPDIFHAPAALAGRSENGRVSVEFVKSDLEGFDVGMLIAMTSEIGRGSTTPQIISASDPTPARAAQRSPRYPKVPFTEPPRRATAG